MTQPTHFILAYQGRLTGNPAQSCVHSIEVLDFAVGIAETKVTKLVAIWKIKQKVVSILG